MLPDLFQCSYYTDCLSAVLVTINIVIRETSGLKEDLLTIVVKNVAMFWAYEVRKNDK